ncbi:unnamed protein product [Caenorhabditis nigoni]
MHNFLSLVLIGVAIIGAAHVASALPTTKECALQDIYFAMSCANQMREFGSKVSQLDANDQGELKEFKKSCNSLDNCFKNMCKPFLQHEDITTAFSTAKTYCGVIDYVHGDFKECGDKLDAAKSTCFDDWDPFLDEDDLKDKKKIEENCKNFFGKDQCMKKEIVAQCGQKDWESFRDHFIKLDEDIMKQCSLKKMFN